MTNADVIRSMSDDELLEFLLSFQQGDIDTSRTFCELCELNDCDGCMKLWLAKDSEGYQGLRQSFS